MIVLLTEEESMRECLKVIIPKLWPNSVEGVDWMVLSFQGKSDLEKSIPKKMRGWHYGNPHFVILRDNDGGDCFVLKRKLCNIAKPYKKPFSVRIVCQELESWLLGDMAAIKQAYPKAAVPKNKAKFRKPDELGNAAQELARLIKVHTKINRTKNIGQYLNLGENRSQSFCVFLNKFRQLIQVCGDGD